jgi:hypothetical protein
VTDLCQLGGLDLGSVLIVGMDESEGRLCEKLINAPAEDLLPVRVYSLEVAIEAQRREHLERDLPHSRALVLRCSRDSQVTKDKRKAGIAAVCERGDADGRPTTLTALFHEPPFLIPEPAARCAFEYLPRQCSGLVLATEDQRQRLG